MFRVIEEEKWHTTSAEYPELEELYNAVDDYVKKNKINNYNLKDAYLVAYNHEGYEISKNEDGVYSWYKLDDYEPDYLDLASVFPNITEEIESRMRR